MKLAWVVLQDIFGESLLVYAFTHEEALNIGKQYLYPQDSSKPFFAIRDAFSDQFALQGKDIELDSSKSLDAWLRIKRAYRDLTSGSNP